MKRLHRDESGYALVTSILIPPLSVFWRLVGALRFRTAFI